MPFNGFRALAESAQSAAWDSYFFKTSGPVPSAAGRWVDLSMGAGTPVYNAYVGDQAAATPLAGSGNRGIYTGPGTSAGQTKHLLNLSCTFTQAVTPVTLALLDLLMVYPLIDGDSTDAQDLDNTLTLPRYTSGAGVMAYLVCTTPMTSNGLVQVDYTDSAGLPQVTTFGVMGAGANVGVIVNTAGSTLVNSGRTAFFPLANASNGIRRIDRVTNLSGMGGFYAVVLCRPMTHMLCRNQNVTTEHSLPLNKGALPQIFSGAYLNFAALTGGAGNPAPFFGQLTTVWN